MMMMIMMMMVKVDDNDVLNIVLVVSLRLTIG